MRLLIAEDEKDLAEALTVFFEKNKFSVDAVYNGRDAYDFGSSGEYDAIILDVMMPKMDGIEVLRRLRSDRIKTPIMMLTAKAEKNDRIVGFDSGADDYLPSPLPPMSFYPVCAPCSAAGRISPPPSSISEIFRSTQARGFCPAKTTACGFREKSFRLWKCL